ncbi:MAG TPA: tRNA adenosine(34) deaminase TadA [Clostridiales bacterium]|nr:tRNA adenosine(34) deaminase TadA [Clostridiales bacterium]
MKAALASALSAAQCGDVPVGAVVVKEGKVIGRGQNRCQSKNDPTAHAEIEAIREAGKTIGDWRLTGCTLYVTLEPCAMCAGAAVNARIERVVIGTREDRTGCCGSICNIFAMPFSGQIRIETGVLEEECRNLLQGFFKDAR